MKQKPYPLHRFLRLIAVFVLIFAFAINVNSAKAAQPQARNNQTIDLGGIDINKYCNNTYAGSTAQLVPPSDAYSWRCKLPDSTYKGTDLNQACQQQYPNTGAYAKLYAPSGPYNWHCERTAAVSTIYVSPSVSPSWTTNSPPCNGTWDGWYRFYTTMNNIGYPNYLTLTAQTSGQSTNSANWWLTIPIKGRWRVSVQNVFHSYYVWPCLGYSLPADTGKAAYKIYYSGNLSATKMIDQEVGGGTWVDLGTYNFDAGTNSGRVFLSDLTGDPLASKYVLFSTIALVYVGP